MRNFDTYESIYGGGDEIPSFSIEIQDKTVIPPASVLRMP